MGSARYVTATLGLPLRPDLDLLALLLTQVIEADRWTNSGALAQRLEHEVATLISSPNAILTSSGTSALTVALMALGLPAGGEVITTPLTFAATAQAIEGAGLVPRFAAVDPVTLTLDPLAVRKAITPNTVAILPVHLFGVAVDPEVDAIAHAHGLPVVYDAAHAFGFASIAGRGAASAYSLHATKLLHTGEGGVIATNDAGIADAARRARNFGLTAEGVAGHGTNAKLPEMSAVLGLAVLPHLRAEVQARMELRGAYTEIVSHSSRVAPHAPGVDRALVMEVVRCAFDDQHDLLRELAAIGVTGRVFPTLTSGDSRWAGQRVVGASDGLDEIARTVIALPFHGRVEQKHVDAIERVFQR